jgi:alpha-tubulin suppressor-like RCC1 family protein
VATDATVRCWGENSLGQVGAPQSHFYEAPNTVLGLGGPVARVSTGVAFSCAILKTGAVACWGDNQQKQLGNPDAETSEKVPMAVVGLAEPVNDVAAVDHSACALLRDGTVMCWGSNDGGQMGKGGIANSVVPLTVDGFSGIAVELAGRGD